MEPVYRCILPKWAPNNGPKAVEGQFSEDQITELNNKLYNIYFLPNTPSAYDSKKIVDGSHIDTFLFVFVDMDLKDGKYESKEAFQSLILNCGLTPTYIVDSGNGIHAYWQVNDLDAMSFLRIQRRLIRFFDTDDSMAKIYQLMRLPGTVNTKIEGAFKKCDYLYQSENTYNCEDLDNFLPIITPEDEQYCQTHYNKTYSIDRENQCIDDKIPLKFAHLLKSSPEVKEIWSGAVNDRSASDFRLGHIMFANGFNKEEATSVLVNSAKALARAPIHRISYATNIVDKIWTYEITKDELGLSSTVREILQKSGDSIKGERFPCWEYVDNTNHGFRLGQVIGLVAGTGVGKTALALNLFQGFVANNPNYEHFFIPLEQPANEIADRWKTMCGENTHLYDKVHVISNYADDGSYRNLSLDDIKEYLLKFKKVSNRQIGCVVIDHIGALKKSNKDGRQSIEDLCHQMKAFAIATNTLLIMQSQAPREKAGIGDLELDKSAAYGTVFFESYCDYLITLWQPIKRCYSLDGCPTVTAFKFCKIRHKKVGLDRIKEDVRYLLVFDPETEHFEPMTEDYKKEAWGYWNNRALNLRKQDSKHDLIEYTTINWDTNGTTDSNSNIKRA